MNRTQGQLRATGARAMQDSTSLRTRVGARRRTLIAGAALICLAGFVKACGSGDSGQMTAGQSMPGEPMMDGEMGPDAVQAQVDRDSASVQQQVIKTATLAIRVDDVTTTGATVVDLVTASEGFVQQQELSNSDGTAYETITARVPADRLDAFIAGVSALGTVEYLTSQASDVTPQVVDLDARVGALQASVTRLEELLAATTNVADLVAVETELANRQSELDSLISQRTYLADQVSYSTVTVSINPVVEAIGATPPGFASGLRNGWTALVTLVGVAITAVGFLLPFVLIAAAIAVPIIIAINAMGKRRRRHESGPGSS